MNTRLWLIAVVWLVSALAAGQASLAGSWQGETNAGATVVLDLAVKGGALSGTLTRNGTPSPITEGKVGKNTFTFKAKLNEQNEVLSGTVDKDTIKIWLDRQGPSSAIVLKRVNR